MWLDRVKAFQRKSESIVYKPTRRVMAGMTHPDLLTPLMVVPTPKHIVMARSACNAARIPIQLYLTVQGLKAPGCEGWKLMHPQGRRSFDRGDAVLDRLLHLLEGAHLDLAHALGRHAELVG